MPKHSYQNNKPWLTDIIARNHESEFHHKDKKKVTFKSNKHGHKKDGKDWNTAFREYLQEEDVDMAINAGTSGRVIKSQKFNKRGPKGGITFPLKKVLDGPSSWYRILLPHGNKYDRSMILKMLTDAIAPLTFLPISWTASGTTTVFYVDDPRVASKLNTLNRQLQLPNGYKLHVRVLRGFPYVLMNEKIKEKMKLVMAKRYNAVNKSLDLTKFHADPDLQDFFCVLFKPVIFIAVLDIISENIPELEAINLGENGLSSFIAIKNLSEKIPNVKILHIGKNNIREINQLDYLKGLPVMDLVLDGNPLCDKYKDQATYISEVRKRFPKVMKLDGIDLPPPISFDIAEEHHLPNPQQTLLCNADGGGIVRQFLEQYIHIYDTENRQPLLQAYHEHATYSMTAAYPYGHGREEKNIALLNRYYNDSRNLLKNQYPERRVKLLKQGQLAIVSFIQEMPQTKHDIHSFTVDLTIFTPQMLLLTVSGLFKELKTGQKVPPLRYFFKTLVIVPAGSGFCIANEEVHFSNATPQQAKDAFKTPDVAVSSCHSQPLHQSPVVNASPVSPPVVALDAEKQEMVKQMAAQSGMNLEWSLKCLEETHWDFQRALLVFQNLNAQGVVPPEAFVQ